MLEIIALLIIYGALTPKVRQRNRSKWLPLLGPGLWVVGRNITALAASFVFASMAINTGDNEVAIFGLSTIGGVVGATIAFLIIQLLPVKALNCPQCNHEFVKNSEWGVVCPSCKTKLKVSFNRVSVMQKVGTEGLVGPKTIDVNRVFKWGLIGLVGAVCITALMATVYFRLEPPEWKVKRVVSTYLKGTLHNDFRRAYAVVSTSDKKVKSLSKFASTSPLTLVGKEYTSHAINSIDVIATNATVDVSVRRPDIESILEDYLAIALVAKLTGDKEAEGELLSQMDAKLKAGDFPFVTEEKTYQLVFEGDAWWVFLDWETQAKEKAQAVKVQESLSKTNELKVSGSVN